MKSVTVCTSIYEAARPFLPDYLDGLRHVGAALGHPVDLVLANDGFRGAAEAFAGAGGAVRIVEARGSRIAGVRCKMIEAAAASNSETILFCDLDDVILPGAARHLAILESADISFGDLRLVDATRNPLSASFLQGAKIPDCISGPDALVEHNFLGFSNTAMRREAIAPAAVKIPDDQETADWWFFTTLLEAGATAARCPEPVAEYRLHEANTLGGCPVPTVAAALARCRLFLAHQAALPRRAARVAASERIERLAAAMTADPAAWTPILRQVCSQPGVWFDDLNAAASYLQPVQSSRNDVLP